MESFAELFEKSIETAELKPGSIIKAEVVQINKDFVVLNAGLKSEGFVPTSQFTDENGNLTVAVGDSVEVALEALEDGFGETKISHEKAQRIRTWEVLEQKFNDSETITGIISGRVKGGFTVDVEGVKAFLPGSLVDVRPVKDPALSEGKEIDFKIIKLDQKRNNIVISRRAVLENEYKAERDEVLKNLQEGDVVKAVVKNLTDYGAFLDIFEGGRRFADLAEAGANLQRPLWASTGVKNPAYRDTMYVDELVSRHVVNTMPEKTLLAVADHGDLRGDTIRPAVDDARSLLGELAAAGVDLADVTSRLEYDGVAKFEIAWADLIRAVTEQLHDH